MPIVTDSAQDFDPGTPPADALDDDHLFAAWAATVAGELLLRVRGSGLEGKELKDAGDLASHELLMKIFAEHRPADAVLSEEEHRGTSGEHDRLTADRVWIIDPVDGTREYSEPPREDWAVHVALWARPRDGELVAGAVAQPALGDDLPHRPAARRTGPHGAEAADRGLPDAGRRPSSRRSPRRSAPSWCRWARPAPR